MSEPTTTAELQARLERIRAKQPVDQKRWTWSCAGCGDPIADRLSALCRRCELEEATE